jgi:hypothetical protein
MYDSLTSSEILRIVFKNKYAGGQIVGLARFVVQTAKTEGLIQNVPDFAYSSPDHDLLGERIMAVYWQLVLEGIYTPGGSIQQPSFSFFKVTEYGRRCFDAGEVTPHDSDGYLKRIQERCPAIDSTTLVYVEEALSSFKAGRCLSSVVMIGVAAESVWLHLTESVKKALDNPDKRRAFERDTKEKPIKRLHDEVLKSLRQPSTCLPTDIDNLIIQHLHAIADLTRRTRNSAGHPTGKQIEREEAHALLILFPTYCGTVSRLMEWLANNKI